jgi:hypothetical protein
MQSSLLRIYWAANRGAFEVITWLRHGGCRCGRAFIVFGVDAVIHGKTLLPYILEVNNDPGMNAFFGLVKDKAYDDPKFMYRTVYSDMIRAVGSLPTPLHAFTARWLIQIWKVRHEAIEAKWRISDLTDFQHLILCWCVSR